MQCVHKWGTHISHGANQYKICFLWNEFGSNFILILAKWFLVVTLNHTCIFWGIEPCSNWTIFGLLKKILTRTTMNLTHVCKHDLGHKLIKWVLICVPTIRHWCTMSNWRTWPNVGKLCWRVTKWCICSSTWLWVMRPSKLFDTKLS